MEKKRLYLVVPRLVEQSTWGGEYILESKGWRNRPEFADLKIGQSYELYSETLLRDDILTTDEPGFTGELCASTGYEAGQYAGDRSKLIKIEDLIKSEPAWYLGEEAIRRHGKKIRILIKYTQAKGNSFQLHVRPGDEGKWLSKPESWYYLEPGILTLGVKKDADWAEYERICRLIDAELREVSRQATAGEIDIDEARKRAVETAKKHDPWRFVNVIRAGADDLIDLSGCGLHHSWESDDTAAPLGNVVYELCLDVMDSVSSIRSFDKGKIKQDGTLRPVHIDDYFRFINRSPETNEPENHRLKKTETVAADNFVVESLLRSEYYCLDKIFLTGSYEGERSDTAGSYHHLFVRRGKIRVKAGDESLEIGAGHSCFIAGGTGRYALQSLDGKSEILKTFVSE